MAVTGGEQSVYVRRTNTIDVTSIWGPYLSPGLRPGTFVYDPTANGAPTYGHAPLTVTARQARLLREGIDQIRVGPRGVGLRVTPVFHFPSVLETYRILIADHALRLVGTVTIDGRRVIEFTGGPWRPNQVRPGGSDPHDVRGETIYLNAQTHLPYRDVNSRGGHTDTVTYTQFQRLPITPANQGLLSLKAHFPSAKVVYNHAAYLRGAGRTPSIRTIVRSMLGNAENGPPPSTSAMLLPTHDLQRRWRVPAHAHPHPARLPLRTRCISSARRAL